ncbi:class I SAM-dependent methyltransferase [Nocardia sp. 004]|uniref:class I SAM-dependent methyltransferase n=1 Tax=Nocardia sp. 004 TaxID=3385978 RepID=UPI0039A3337B
MSRNPLAVAEPWDLVADGYAEFAAAIMQPFAARALEFVSLAPTAQIVDVAAGPGTLSLLAAEHVALVEAIDFSEPMIARLAKDAVAAGLSNIRAQVGDGQNLPFESDRFDAGFSMFGLMFFPERAKGFAELFRVLRPGGTAVVSSWAPVADSPLMRMMFDALAAADPSVQEPQANFLSLENPELFESEMRGAGFEAISIQRHSIALSFAEPEELWETMVRSSAPLELMRQSVGPEVWAERATLMREFLTERYRPHSPLSTTAYLGIGHKPLR